MSLFPNKEVKQFINSLTCPICKCSLEGIPRLLSDRHTELIELYCSQHQDSFWGNHRKVDVQWDLNLSPVEPKITYELMCFMHQNIKYDIAKFCTERIDISIFERDKYGWIAGAPTDFISSKELKIELEPFDPEKIVETIELFRFYS